MKSLEDLIKSKDVVAIKEFMKQNNLILLGNKIIPRDDLVKKEFKRLKAFWKQRQQSRKILLNSLYGALLNEAMRFYDERLGQSTTLNGRSIVKHMSAKINEIITGDYDHKGESIRYNDTDSAYFSAYDIWKNLEVFQDFDWSRDNIINCYDMIADEVNETFADFVYNDFNVPKKRGTIIQGGRELVASRVLFIRKKKYAALMYEYDGKRYDNDNNPGELKVMGLDLKRADTPKFMQEFLNKLLIDILVGEKTREEMNQKIIDFREEFKLRPAWEKGSPKKVNDLLKYAAKLDKANTGSIMNKIDGKVNMPGHVRASINWNILCDMNDDKYSLPINDGTRIIVCQLKSNAMGMTSIAYPIDQHNLPAWFKNLPFDESSMEEKIIDMKLENLVGVLNWNLADTKENFFW